MRSQLDVSIFHIVISIVPSIAALATDEPSLDNTTNSEPSEQPADIFQLQTDAPSPSPEETPTPPAPPPTRRPTLQPQSKILSPYIDVDVSSQVLSHCLLPN